MPGHLESGRLLQGTFIIDWSIPCQYTYFVNACLAILNWVKVAQHVYIYRYICEDQILVKISLGINLKLGHLNNKL